MKTKIYTLVVAVFLIGFLSAQNVLTGRIVDKKTQEALPFVNIKIYPGGEGTTSDLEGLFSIESKTKIHKAEFTFVGYKTYTYKAINQANKDIRIELLSSGIEIDETVVVAKRKRGKVPKDTAARSLQQKVVDNKFSNRPKSFDSYYYREHTKVEFDFYQMKENFTKRKFLQPFSVMFDYIDTTDSGVRYVPLLLQEKLSEHYFKKDPNRQKKIKLAQYMTGVENMSALVILDDIFENLDLYSNTIVAGGKSFTSPFSGTGLMTYRYYLTDTIKEKGKNYYRLNFYPKSKESVSFQGFALIDSISYAIKYIEFRLPPKANVNFMSELKVSQKFEEVLPNKWMLKSEFIQLALNPLNKKKGRQIMVRKGMDRGNIQVNTFIPDSIFDGEYVTVADSIKNRTTTWWAKNRVQELSETESGVVTMIDSIERTRAYKNYKWLGNVASTAFLKAGPIEFGRFYQFISWNNVEGIRPKMGIRTNEDFNENMQLWGYLAYGTKDKIFKPFVNVRLKLPRDNFKWHILEFNYKKDYTFLGQDYDDQQFAHDNIVLALLRTAPLEKIILMENLTATYEREWWLGYTTRFSIGPKIFHAVPGIFEFEHVNDDGTIDNRSKIHVSEINISQHFGFNQKFYENKFNRFEGFSKFPVADLSYTLGLKRILGGEYSYHKFELEFKQRLSSKAGYTNYNIFAGKIIGKVPYTLMFIPIANSSFYFNKRAYQLMNEFEFVVDQYAAMWIEHHFDGALFNRIPGLKILKLRSLVSIKGIIGDSKKSNLNELIQPDQMSSLENWYIEAGFGIENILQIARCDFYWRLTQRDKPNVQKFGVRIAITPNI